MIVDALRSHFPWPLKDVSPIDAPQFQHDSLQEAVRWFVETKSRHPETVNIDFSKIQHGIDKIKFE